MRKHLPLVHKYEPIPNVGFKTFKKIDIYAYAPDTEKFIYMCSTMASKTCREAKHRYCEKHGLEGVDQNNIKCFYAK
jgi:hypothetical protein